MLDDFFASLAALNALELLYVVTATALGSIVSGLSGMGGGALIAIAITPIVGIGPLVPTITIAMLVNHVARVWVFRAHVVWRPALLVLGAATPFAVFGSIVYVNLPANTVAIVMGVFLIVFTPMRRILAKHEWHLGDRGLMAVGAVFGFITGTTIGAGAIIIPALLGMGLTGQMLVGTDAIIGLIVLIAKAATFSTLDRLDTRLIAVGLLVGLCSVPGVYLARWIIKRTSMRLHTVFVEGLIVLAGCSFILRGLST